MTPALRCVSLMHIRVLLYLQGLTYALQSIISGLQSQKKDEKKDDDKNKK